MNGSASSLNYGSRNLSGLLLQCGFKWNCLLAVLLLPQNPPNPKKPSNPHYTHTKPQTTAPPAHGHECLPLGPGQPPPKGLVGSGWQSWPWYPKPSKSRSGFLGLKSPNALIYTWYISANRPQTVFRSLEAPIERPGKDERAKRSDNDPGSEKRGWKTRKTGKGQYF